MASIPSLKITIEKVLYDEINKRLEALEKWREEINYGRDDIPAQPEPEFQVIRCPSCGSTSSNFHLCRVDPWSFYECVFCDWTSETFKTEQEAREALRERLKVEVSEE